SSRGRRPCRPPSRRSRLCSFHIPSYSRLAPRSRRRGISCISGRFRRDKDRSARLAFRCVQYTRPAIENRILHGRTLGLTLYLVVLASVLTSIAQRGSKVTLSLYALDLGAGAFAVGLLGALFASFPLILA